MTGAGAGAATARRELLLEVAMAGAAALAACAGAGLARAETALAEGADAHRLASMVQLELTLAYAYGALLGRPGLDRRTRDLLGLLRSHEQEHAGAILTLLADAGGSAPRGTPGAREVEQLVPGFQTLARPGDILRYAVSLEEAAVAAHYHAQAKLTDARAIQTTASVMSSEGQHLVMLRTALGRDPVPHALETGAA